MAHVCLSSPVKLCVFHYQALVFTFFWEGILLQLIGNNKSGKANVRGHAVIGAEN